MQKKHIWKMKLKSNFNIETLNMPINLNVQSR